MATIYYERFELEDKPVGRLVGAHVFHDASCPPMRARGLYMCGIGAPDGLCEVERIDAPFHVLLFVLDGEAELFEGEQRWRVGPGQFGVLPRGGRRGFRRSGAAVMPHVWFLLCDDARWAFLDQPSCWVGESAQGHVLWDAVSLFQREASLANAGQPGALMIPALDLLGQQLKRALADHQPQDGRLHELQLLLNAVLREPADDWSNERLAAKLHITPAHLHRLCRLHLGQAPGQLVFGLRMQRARELLQDGHPVHAVATRVGYCELASFSRRFRQHFGVPPSVMARGGAASEGA
ncbi:helix-turn-helix transcriptional regulator [Chitinilyticum litopenaei]|uniref:helix-turn-helix transcriptional regulator n=1 Tax=Chitinilyticum litopenaei TaxID=1121276 RepID=UPI0003F9BAAC|nr:AraC family transcriptional regulator [Chitinilyticum litopenaei]